jgi:cytochrome c biogenesis protein CcmG/thiol:disulfide interchange protein DsbE
MTRRKGLTAAVLMALALAVIAAGCGGSGGGEGGSHPSYAKLESAPEPLAKLYGEGNKLLPGGTEAFEKRLAELKGHPVVVNVWASWCGPCRFEFPMFQEASAKFGKRVGFIGADSEDSEKEAEKWLADNPVPYPSYYETGFDYASSLKASGPPDTAFYNAKGELLYVKLGQYAHESDLEADIKRYALGGA